MLKGHQLLDERIAEHTIDDDDPAWTGPYVDAPADIAIGKTHACREHDVRMNRLLTSMKELMALVIFAASTANR